MHYKMQLYYNCMQINASLTYASRGECINMKRAFWMHKNASECNMSRTQQVRKCIRMQPPHIGGMQQLKNVLNCVRM
jgi:hypothetical protein